MNQSEARPPSTRLHFQHYCAHQILGYNDFLIDQLFSSIPFSSHTPTRLSSSIRRHLQQSIPESSLVPRPRVRVRGLGTRLTRERITDQMCTSSCIARLSVRVRLRETSHLLVHCHELHSFGTLAYSRPCHFREAPPTESSCCTCTWSRNSNATAIKDNIYINFNDNGRPGDPYVKSTDKYIIQIHTC